MALVGLITSLMIFFDSYIIDDVCVVVLSSFKLGGPTPSGPVGVGGVWEESGGVCLLCSGAAFPRDEVYLLTDRAAGQC